MYINFYYDYSGELSTDPEGNSVQLCGTCAMRARDEGLEIQHASDNAEACELCDAVAE